MDEDVKYHTFPIAQRFEEQWKEMHEGCYLAICNWLDQVKLAWYTYRYPNGDTNAWFLAPDGLVYPA